MNNKKIIIAIVLGIGAFFSLIYGIVTPPRGRHGTPVSNAPEVLQDYNRAQPVVKAQDIRRRAKRSRFTAWKRNPFIPTQTAGPAISLVLNGIVGSSKNPKAIIGDLIVGVGDKVGPYKVTAIKQNRVILNDGTKDLELKLKD